MPRRMTSAFMVLLTSVAMLAGAAGAQAEPGSLRVLVTSNTTVLGLTPALEARSDVAVVDEFDTSTGTPSAASLATYDLVVSIGDFSYTDPALWGDRLADFIDAGGAVMQFAYDNAEDDGAHPTGRFESGGYPPFIPGPVVNNSTSLGDRLVPDSPLLAGVGSFTSASNTNTTLRSGATLLAKFDDGRNAIATKGRVVSLSAWPDEGDFDPVAAAAQLAANAGNALGRHLLTVTKTGAGSGTVTSAPAGIDCGATCAARMPFGDAVTLTAVPGAGAAFAGWTGACSGADPCQAVIGATDQTISAAFASTKRCGNPSVGTGDRDVLQGSKFGDKLKGRGGNDKLRGASGDDCLNGGAGNDLLAGGPGNDRLGGGKGKDTAKGGAGKDVIDIADDEKDKASCGGGKDRVKADAGDVLSGCEKVKEIG